MNNDGIFKRLWIYQAERFPLVAHGPMVIIFCFAVLGFGSEGEYDRIEFTYLTLATAVLSVLLLFFQLRVADEFKDAESDSRYRPERAVPRGLVALEELAFFACAAAFVQLTAVLLIDWRLLSLLVLVWSYMGLMTREFFAPRWLQSHPVIYLISHMLVMPLITFYVSAFGWISSSGEPPRHIGLLLTLSFFIGVILELGRKIKSARNEKNGVETYSRLWGVKTALLVWSMAVWIAAITYAAIALPSVPAMFLLCLVVAAAVSPLVMTRYFLAGKVTDFQIELMSGLLALVFYLGLAPLRFAVALGGV